MEKVDDSTTPTFSCGLPVPPNFAHPPDNVASLGISPYEINEDFPLLIAPNVVSLPHEGRRDGLGVVHIRPYYTPLAQVIKGKYSLSGVSPLPLYLQHTSSPAADSTS